MTKCGILVHGRHVLANGWDRLVWGDPTEQKLGSLPMMVLTALNLGLEDIVVIFGTGASERDGVKEADCMKRLLQERQEELINFDVIRHHPNYRAAKLTAFLVNIITEIASQNTNQEVENAAKLFDDYDVGMVFQVSSASHLPRCVKTVSELREKGLMPKGQMWCGVADDMTFGDLGAAATAIFEPPHRGDDPMTAVDPKLWPNVVFPQLFKTTVARRVPLLDSFRAAIQIALT